jgi:hypothetical protein
MYGPGPVPFNDGYAVASIDLSIEYEVILLTSEGTNVRCKWDEGGFPTIWDRTGQAGAKQAAEKLGFRQNPSPQWLKPN